MTRPQGVLQERNKWTQHISIHNVKTPSNGGPVGTTVSGPKGQHHHQYQCEVYVIPINLGNAGPEYWQLLRPLQSGSLYMEKHVTRPPSGMPGKDSATTLTETC